MIAALHIAALFICIAVAFVFILYLTGRKKADTDRRLEGTLLDKRGANVLEMGKADDEKDAEKKIKLAEKYCDTRQAVMNCKVERAYDHVFDRYHRIYQVIIGLKCRAQKESLSDEFFLDELIIELENCGVAKVLNADGFLVEERPETLDRENYMKKLLSMDERLIKIELGKQERELLSEREAHHSRPYMEKTGPDLYRLIQAAAKGEGDVCRKIASSIQTSLESGGCIPLFADQKEVLQSEDLRLNYIDDSADATELPGLYFRDKEGKYVLIGVCIGTRRRAK